MMMAANSTISSSELLYGPKVALIGCGPGGMFILRHLEKERKRLFMDLERETNNQNELFASATSSSSANNNPMKSTRSNQQIRIQEKIQSLPRITVFEKESRCGGLWQSRSNGEEEGGAAAEQGRMYDGLWINAPKEYFEFQDYTFDDHFNGTAMPSYMIRSQVLEYLEGATKDGIAYHTTRDATTNIDEEGGSIQFNTEVTLIDTYNEDDDDDYDYDDDDDDEEEEEEEEEKERVYNNNKNNKFEIHVTKVIDHSASAGSIGKSSTTNSVYYDFDKVIVATGMYNQMSIPYRELVILTQQQYSNNNNNSNNKVLLKYDGHILHSSQVNQLQQRTITNKRFLFIGSSYSAEDLALSFLKRGAAHIYITTRSNTYSSRVEVIKSWPMDKVSILTATEIKNVVTTTTTSSSSTSSSSSNISNNNKSLRMGPVNDDYDDDDDFDEEEEDIEKEFILEDIDAVIFCTGYEKDFGFIVNELRDDDNDYSDDANGSNIVSSYTNWPNIYDPMYGPIPSALNSNRCATTDYTTTQPFYANPINNPHNKNPFLYNGHILSNPSMFYLRDAVGISALLEIDINAAVIVKAIIDENDDENKNNNEMIPKNKDNNKEIQRQQQLRQGQQQLRELSIEMFHDVRNLGITDVGNDERDAAELDLQVSAGCNQTTLEKVMEYSLGYLVYKLGVTAKKGNHSAQSLIVEINNNNYDNNDDDCKINNDNEDDDDNDNVCSSYVYADINDDSYNSNNTRIMYKLSKRGMLFLQMTLDEYRSIYDIEKGTNQTFRDQNYHSFQSIYTGTQSTNFPTLWMNMDDH